LDEGTDIDQHFPAQRAILNSGAYNKNLNIVDCITSTALRIRLTNYGSSTIIYDTPVDKKTGIITKSTTKTISTFLNGLLDTNISVISKAEDFKNYGFDIGIAGHGLKNNTKNFDFNNFDINQAPHGLKGGNSYDINIFLDLNKVPSGLTMVDRLKSIYGDNVHHISPATRIYNGLFRGLTSEKDSKNLLFSLIINYFHVYNVSFSSIYGGLCFPSILYNASVMTFAIKRFSNVLSSVDYNVSDNVRSQMFKFFKDFFSVVASDNFLQENSHPLNQICYLPSPEKVRFENGTYQNIIKEYENVKPTVKINQYYSSFYTVPSVSSDFLNFLLKLITPRYSEMNITNHKFDLSPLFTSNYISTIRHMDLINTYVSVVFSLLKQTTRFSADLSVDTTQFRVDNHETFSLEYPFEL
jgi:hypothetical protein